MAIFDQGRLRFDRQDLLEVHPQTQKVVALAMSDVNGPEILTTLNDPMQVFF
jgi:hypothetical protein